MWVQKVLAVALLVECVFPSSRGADFDFVFVTLFRRICVMCQPHQYLLFSFLFSRGDRFSYDMAVSHPCADARRDDPQALVSRQCTDLASIRWRRVGCRRGGLEHVCTLPLRATAFLSCRQVAPFSVFVGGCGRAEEP